MKKIVALAAAAIVAAAPVMAQNVPAVGPINGEKLSEGEAAIVAVAMTAGIVTIAVLAFSNDDDQPVSA